MIPRQEITVANLAQEHAEFCQYAATAKSALGQVRDMLRYMYGNLGISVEDMDAHVELVLLRLSQIDTEYQLKLEEAAKLTTEGTGKRSR